MELMYEKVVIIGVVILAACVAALLYTHKKVSSKYVKGLRAANTKKIRESLVYKKLEKKPCLNILQYS